MKRDKVQTATHTTYIFDKEGFNRVFQMYGLQDVVWDMLGEVVRYKEYVAVGEKAEQWFKAGTLAITGVLGEDKPGFRASPELVFISFKSTESWAAVAMKEMVFECVASLMETATEEAEQLLGSL
jgi:hypothetical protein